MDVSVIIATYNRARLLTETLTALIRQRFDSPLDWEILIVDNNSTDNTRETVQRFERGAKVPIRYLFEGQQGKSCALNAGIAVAQGEVVAFTDDDIVPDEHWVESIVYAMSHWGADGVGGKIFLNWEKPPPAFVLSSRSLLGCLGLLGSEKAGMVRYPLTGEFQVWGGNMAFRRSVIKSLGGFDPVLGPRGKKIYRAEDIVFVMQAVKQGYTIAYDPAITVWHWVPVERTRKSYFRRWAFDSGEGDALAGDLTTGSTLFGAPRWMYLHVLKQFGRFLCAVAKGNKNAFEQQLAMLSELGMIYGYWKQAWSRLYPKAT